MNTTQRRSIPIVMLGCLLLAACGSTTTIERPSTYVGDITPAHLQDVYLAVPGDKRLAFRDVFKGFEPQTGFLTDPLPFRKIAVADIIYEAAQPVAAYYDANANNNGYLEGPELLVLYIRESAIGLGHSVDYVGVNPRFNALATSAADTGGLMVFVKKNKATMTENAQRIFRDLEQMGLDRRNRGGGGSGGAGGGGGGN
jgi:hypothetical protein